VRRGARVPLVVSTGEPAARGVRPNVVGQEQATAAGTLRSAGFRVVVLNRPTTNQSQNGLVVEQQPRAGSNVPGGSQVTIFVGRFSG
jgi:beta-lactam-binding protein with PASTA domain